MTRHFSSMLNALAAIVGALILAFLVVRPILAYLSREPGPSSAGAGDATKGRGLVPGSSSSVASAAGDGAVADTQLAGVEGAGNLQLAGVSSYAEGHTEPYALDRHDQVVNQLAGLIDQSEERAAFVIRDWLASGAGAES